MSASVFIEGAPPRCVGCCHEKRCHRWTAPYACLVDDCCCEHVFDRDANWGHGGWTLLHAPAGTSESEASR